MNEYWVVFQEKKAPRIRSGKAWPNKEAFDKVRKLFCKNNKLEVLQEGLTLEEAEELATRFVSSTCSKGWQG